MRLLATVAFSALFATVAIAATGPPEVPACETLTADKATVAGLVASGSAIFQVFTGSPLRLLAVVFAGTAAPSGTPGTVTVGVLSTDTLLAVSLLGATSVALRFYRLDGCLYAHGDMGTIAYFEALVAAGLAR